MLGRRSILLAPLAAALLAHPVAASDKPVVAAAADLNAALPEIAALFAKATARQVEITFGSSGNFTQQIEQGAPFAMLLSADEAYVTRLAAAGRTVDGGALYAVGRIGVFAPAGSALQPDSTLADLAAALTDGRLKRFAIANPEHAPYGRAAREALQHAGLWEKIEGRLVLGENVAQAAQFAASGSAQGGIIPLSLAKAPAIAALGSFALLPEDWHAPLRQRMVLLKGAGATAREFYAFMQSPAARAVLIRYGFAPPGETS
jgi:molybdate transport system substrate-binding protein